MRGVVERAMRRMTSLRVFHPGSMSLGWVMGMMEACDSRSSGGVGGGSSSSSTTTTSSNGGGGGNGVGVSSGSTTTATSGSGGGGSTSSNSSDGGGRKPLKVLSFIGVATPLGNEGLLLLIAWLKQCHTTTTTTSTGTNSISSTTTTTTSTGTSSSSSSSSSSIITTLTKVMIPLRVMGVITHEHIERIHLPNLNLIYED